MGEEDLSGRALIGRRFGSYVVEALIGAGGMGAVYRAVQPEIGKQVAIKFLSTSLSAQPELVQRFFAEARSVNLIQHDNIVDIFDFGSADGVSWFVMELLRGRSLSALMSYEPMLSLARAVDICAQIADAIAAAHARGIIHRDLKGDNIFLVSLGGREDFVKILDFGIAKLSDPGSFGSQPGGPYSKTRTGAILGTPGYMSPEQGTGGSVDGRTDVYALGVIAYRLLAGRLPFEGVNHLEIVQKQLTLLPPPLSDVRSDVPIELAQLIHQMIERQPEARPQKMAEVRDRLRALAPLALRGPSQPVLVAATAAATRAGARTTLSGASGQLDTAQALAAAGMAKRSRIGLFVAVGAIAFIGAGAAVLLMRPRAATTIASAPPAAAPPTAAAPAAAPPAVAPPAVAPPAVAPPAVAPPAVAPPRAARPSGFECLVETDPPGAEVLRDGKTLGRTPVTLKLAQDPTDLKLRLDGYGDEDLEVARDTEHAIVRMHHVMQPHQTMTQAHQKVMQPHQKNAPVLVLPKAPPAKTKKATISLDD